MEIEAENQSGDLGTLIFAQTYYNLPGVWESEWVGYYPATNIDRLRNELKSHIEHQLDLFSESADYEDHFSAADYGNPEDDISPEELPLFRAALPEPERQMPLSDLHPSDQLAGYRAVILNQVASGDLVELQSAADRFNWLVEAAIEGVDNQNARSYITIQTEKEFAPSFIAGLPESIDRLQEPRRYDPYSDLIGETFAPLRPLLEILRPSVSQPAWPPSDLALGKFRLIVDYFKAVAEKYSVSQC